MLWSAAGETSALGDRLYQRRETVPLQRKREVSQYGTLQGGEQG